MTSAERMVMVAARSESLLADFVVLFLARWALKYADLDYLYYQPFWDQASPPLALADFHYPASALFYGSMYFVSGLPEVVFAGLWFVYAVVMLSLFGQTLGMRQAGITIVDENGRRPGIGRIIVRQMIAPISSIGWIGYWCAAFAPHASTLHDLISRTRIVYTEKRNGGNR